jgi:hypothetical protein
LNRLLPPSITMSPGASSGSSRVITSSTGAPAFTMIQTLRGRARLPTRSSSPAQPSRRPAG